MSSEAIEAVLPRATEPRPASVIPIGPEAQRQAPTELDRLRATTRGEGSRGEDASRYRDARHEAIQYPDPGPKLPPALIPLREVPPPDVRAQIESSNPVAEQLVAAASESIDGGSPESTPPASAGPEPGPDPDARTEAEARAGRERTLAQVVMAQQPEGTSPVDVQVAGQLVSETA